MAGKIMLDQQENTDSVTEKEINAIRLKYTVGLVRSHINCFSSFC